MQTTLGHLPAAGAGQTITNKAKPLSVVSARYHRAPSCPYLKVTCDNLSNKSLARNVAVCRGMSRNGAQVVGEFHIRIIDTSQPQRELVESESNAYQREAGTYQMEDSNLSERLRELARGKNRSATARIREKFDDIEAALKASVPRIDVHKALVEDGIQITFESFELTIYRIRKERKQQNRNTASQTRPAPLSGLSGAEVTNPLRDLSGRPKEGEFNPISMVNFELDKSERK